jgi:hypothetical protein
MGVRASPRGCVLFIERETSGAWRECASLEIIGTFEFEGACRELAKKAVEVLRCERLLAEVEARLKSYPPPPASPPTA